MGDNLGSCSAMLFKIDNNYVNNRGSTTLFSPAILQAHNLWLCTSTNCGQRTLFAEDQRRGCR
jgi:hypothetical protein